MIEDIRTAFFTFDTDKLLRIVAKLHDVYRRILLYGGDNDFLILESPPREWRCANYWFTCTGNCCSACSTRIGKRYSNSESSQSTTNRCGHRGGLSIFLSHFLVDFLILQCFKLPPVLFFSSSRFSLFDARSASYWCWRERRSTSILSVVNLLFVSSMLCWSWSIFCAQRRFCDSSTSSSVHISICFSVAQETHARKHRDSNCWGIYTYL